MSQGAGGILFVEALTSIRYVGLVSTTSAAAFLNIHEIEARNSDSSTNWAASAQGAVATASKASDQGKLNDGDLGGLYHSDPSPLDPFNEWALIDLGSEMKIQEVKILNRVVGAPSTMTRLSSYFLVVMDGKRKIIKKIAITATPEQAPLATTTTNQCDTDHWCFFNLDHADYKLVDHSRYTWYFHADTKPGDAVLHCETDGENGGVADVLNSDDQTRLNNLIGGASDVFLGASRSGDVWTWMSGRKISFFNKNSVVCSQSEPGAACNWLGSSYNNAGIHLIARGNSSGQWQSLDGLSTVSTRVNTIACNAPRRIVHELFQHTSNVNQAAAKTQCENKGGWLATIRSAGDMRYLRIDMSTGLSTTTPVLLAGSDADVEGTWKWKYGPTDTQNEVFWTGTATGTSQLPSGFSHWHPGEPNGGETVQVMYRAGLDYRWNDQGGGSTWYLCQFRWPQTPTLTVSREKFYGAFVHGTDLDQDGAYQQCLKKGGHLATIRSATEFAQFQTDVEASTPQFTGYAWTGGSKPVGTLDWRWTYGPPEGRDPIFSIGNACQSPFFCFWQATQGNAANQPWLLIREKSSGYAWYDRTAPSPSYICEFPVIRKSMSLSESTTEGAPVIVTETETNTHEKTRTAQKTRTEQKTRTATPVLPVASHTATVSLPLPVAAPLYSDAECALRPVRATLVDFAGVKLDAANSTWVQQVAAVDVRDSGFSFSFKLLSCHEFSASQKLFTLVGTATGAQSMASLAAGPYQFVQQKVSGLGKVVTVKVGPLSIYSPRTVDSLTFEWNKDMFRVPLASDSLVGSRRQQTTNSSAKNYKVSVVSRTVGMRPTVSTVSSGGAAIGGAVSIFGGPGMAAAANRQALLSNVANCPQLLSDESLHWSHNPTGLTIGVSIFRYHLGTLLGNSIIAVGILFIHFLIGLIVKLWVGCTIVDAVGHVRLPARSLPAVTFLMQPTLTSAFIVASYSEDVQHIISCAFISVISLVVVLSTGWILVMWKPPRFDVKFWKKPHDPTRTCLSKATYCTGHYIPADLNRMHFVRILGAIFEDYNPDVRYFFFVDLLIMGISAYLMAIFPDSATDCEWTFIGALVIFGTYTLICFVTWPFTALVLNLVFTFTAFSQFLSALLMFFAFSQNDESLMLWSEVFNLIGLGLQLFNLLYDVLMGIFELATRDDQNTKVTRIATALEKAKIHRADAVLTRGFSSCFSRHQVSETIEYVYLRDNQRRGDASDKKEE